MAECSELIGLMKRAATEAVGASQPADVLFGKVQSASPLNIIVDQKMILAKEQLVLARAVTDHTESVTVSWNTANDTHTHDITCSEGSGSASSETHHHAVSGTKIMTVHGALKTGDQVILLQCAGGQKFIVLDRLG